MIKIEGRKMNEACGVIGIHRVEDAESLAYYGLHSLQHRGQESAGICASDGKRLHTVKGKGLVTEVFDKERMADLMPAFQAVGHVRYSTSGENITENIQPLMVRSHQGDFALVHNGQLVNAPELRYELEMGGSIFQGTSDTEVIIHLIQREEGSFAEKIMKACRRLEGSFSIVIMTKTTMYAIRDRFGLRPLSVGLLDDGYVISSETCAFEIVNAKFWRDIEPGEVLKFGKDSVRSAHFAEAGKRSMCAMEYIYFARPDSVIDGINIHSARRRSGKILARGEQNEVDIVIGVPDSSLSAAMGYADALDLPYEMGLIKNKYIGRTFIQPTQKERDRGVKMKLSAIASIVKGKRIILVDDSIVRGTTSVRIVKLLREAGATEVHVRIVSPPLINPCFYGIDLSSKDQLISASNNVDELCKYIQADSLRFLSLEQLKEVCGENICTACFSGDYVTQLFSHNPQE